MEDLMKHPQQTLCAGGGATIDAPVKVPDKVPFNLGKNKGNDHDEPYKVILWNDSVNDMGHVMTILVKVFPELDIFQAQRLMLIAHKKGSVIIGAYPKERAEVYRQGLENGRLTATIEKA